MELRGIKGIAIGTAAIASVICLGIFLPAGLWLSKTFWVIVSTVVVFGDLLYKRRWLIRERKIAMLSVLLATHVFAWIALVSRFHPRNETVFLLILLLEGAILQWLLAEETAAAG